MRRSQPASVLGGLLICGLGLGFPGASYAVGCTNANLMGTYTTSVANSSFLALLNSVNTPSGSSASTFINSPFGASGSIPYAAQFYFDGQGNITGPVASPPAVSTNAGTYSVNADCSATLSFASGATFNAVVVNGGGAVLFMQNNAGGGGAVGTLERYSGACVANSPQNLAFSFFGSQKVSNPSSGGSTATSAATFNPVSAVGQLQLNGQGGFVMQEWVYQYGKTTATTLSGTYTVRPDCSLSLTFTQSGANSVTVPVQPGNLAGITGTFLSQ